MKIAITLVHILVALLVIDFLGFLLWALSGQHPVDGFYVGTLTAHVISIF